MAAVAALEGRAVAAVGEAAAAVAAATAAETAAVTLTAVRAAGRDTVAQVEGA